MLFRSYQIKLKVVVASEIHVEVIIVQSGSIFPFSGFVLLLDFINLSRLEGFKLRVLTK